MAVNQDNEFWRGFINLYRALPELWQVKNDVYRDRYKKTLAYEKLIDYLKTKDKNVNKELVKRKLNTLRGSYRRERKKVENWKPTTKVEERYVTSLWYYDDLDAFLNDQEIGADEGSSICETETTNDSSNCSFSEQQPNRKKAKHNNEEPKETTTTAIKDLKNMNDCSEIYGMAWAAQFRQLAPDQQIHAKRAMDEILYEGMLGILPQTQSTYCRCSKPTNSSLPTPHSSTTISTSWAGVEDCKFELPTLQIPLDDENDINNPLKQEVD